MHQKIKINKIKVSVTKADIVKQFVLSYESKVYTPKQFAKNVCIKFLKILGVIGFIAGVILSNLFVSPKHMYLYITLRALMLLVVEVMVLFCSYEGIREDFMGERFSDMKQKLEKFHWLCDVLEHEIRFKDCTELLNTDYVINTHYCLMFMNRIVNGQKFKAYKKDGSLYVKFKKTAECFDLCTEVQNDIKSIDIIVAGCKEKGVGVYVLQNR